MNWKWHSSVLVAGLAVIPMAGSAQSRRPDYELPPIRYSSSQPDDAVARLLKRIENCEVGFSGTDTEILQAVLRELHVPVQSQIVVFSKTSMQSGLINPRNPRVLYFSDSVYVGWVPGGLMEVAAIDPKLGPIYYALDPQDARDARRTFVRESSCLRCHGEYSGGKIPALLTRSILATENGEVVAGQGAQPMNETMPFEQRWGGWFVTGYTGQTNHRGNAFAQEQDGTVSFTTSDKRPVNLSEFFDTSKYLVPTSDIAALLIFQHQVTMHNVLTRSFHRSRRLLVNNGEKLDETTRSTLREIAKDVVDHLLFREAAPLPSGIGISDEFRRAFAVGIPRDGNGNSLKDFSGNGRLFKNRCSFLIYSDAFAELPAPLKAVIFEQFHAALNESEGNLEPDERKRILAILNDTLPEAREAFSRVHKQ